MSPRVASGPAYAALRRGEQWSRLRRQRERASAFTLIELLVVIGIIGLLMALLVPAVTSLRRGTDVTSAANTIKGVLDTARTYAKANNTYTWVGFFEEDISSATPATAGTGRLVMSIVASKDGTNVASGGLINPANLIQVDKLTKIENVHLATFTDGLGQSPGTTFDTRPPVTFNGTQYRIGDTSQPPDSTTPFQYPVGSPYTFVKAVQFSSSGEARIDNNTYSPQTAAEIGLRRTHGTAVDTNSPNVVAIQFTGEGGNVTVYRK
jgi:prepilin-type N-terminal cleavage/methylation domain-containing protein